MEAIERSRGALESWLRESTLLVPVFVFAVLGALTLTLRWFGPALSRKDGARRRAADRGGGTLTGVMARCRQRGVRLPPAGRAARSGTPWPPAPKLPGSAAARHAGSRRAQAVFYGIGILLVTNLVPFAWVVALRGGRSTSPRRIHGRSRRCRASVRSTTSLLLAAGGRQRRRACGRRARGTERVAARGEFLILLATAGLALAGWVLIRLGRVSTAGHRWCLSPGPLCCGCTFGMPSACRSDRRAV